MNKIKIQSDWVVLPFLFCIYGQAFTGKAQSKQYRVYAAAFYNLENLFDTDDDPTNAGDDEFTPKGKLRWTPEKYQKKLHNMAYAISQIAREHSPVGPEVLGVAEIENRKVLEDLISQPDMADMHYQIVQYDSPDRRGIDVALLYNPRLFQVTSSRVYPFHLADESAYRSRDQLLVSGKMADEDVHFIVAHWPSRFGGSKSSYLREAAAVITRHVIDSLQQNDPLAKIIFMGDLNDDPSDVSVRKVLDAKKNVSDVSDGGLYNPMWQLLEKGAGSLAYQGGWNMFDQIILSQSLLRKDTDGLRYWKAEVFNKPFLVDQEGKLGRRARSNKGYPLRTFIEGTFINGYSDHFPVLIYLIKPHF
ncbi:endonuclease/exonuclease/phosphatase family protein [Sphingobacterium chungjuense]|uniref:endonuclease/exonuclease/phosphatase family protein n=1 Tax=Sphingobacterium chungjuense TaxID=2675553 RepID=UPI001408A537|nr:endonuclease/exonuclease/phosphatase family protein [Sphingobacterium chungjuense]